MPVQFNLESFPSVVLVEKKEKLTKEHLTEGEYQILKDFVNIIQSDPQLNPDEELIDPLSIINIVYDKRGSVLGVYGPSIGKNEEENGLIVYCNKIKYPIDFVESEGVFFNKHKIMPILAGKEYEKENSKKKKIKIQPCNGLIDKFQLNISIDVENPFSQNDQIIFMSSFMMGDEDNFKKFVKCVDFPKTGGGRVRPNLLEPGIYLVQSHEVTQDNYGTAVNLDLLSLIDNTEIKTFSCSYFKEKFLVFNAGAIRTERKLYLIVDETTITGGKASFNGSFTFNPQEYLDKVKVN
jgi:hypothetical protein